MIKQTSLNFLAELKNNNSREWFEQNKIIYQDYKDDIISFTENLLSELQKLDLSIAKASLPVTKIVKEMIKAGLCQNLKTADKRKTLIGLTEKGNMLSEKFQNQYLDIDNAIGNMINEANHNLWEAVAEWEYLLEKKALSERVKEQKKIRESKDVVIVPYEDKYRIAYRELNTEWIKEYFEMEEKDYKVLDNPQEYVLNNGGKIFVALYKGEPLGVCALIKMNDGQYDFELAKMAVSPKAQGKHLGLLLGKEIIKEAKKMGGKKLYLESNTNLKPAIRLYEKLGFKKVSGKPSPYKRVDIQMALYLETYND